MNVTRHQLPATNYQLGLIGYPLSHSLSPKIHTAALKACDLKGDYSLFPVHPEDKQGLKKLLDQVRSGEIHGLNVTIPHKQNVIEFMDELTPTAKSIGAVNTIYLKDNKLIGDNTDAHGFLTDLKKIIGNQEMEIQNRKPVLSQVEASAIVLGAGGSARAVVYALLNDGWNVTIASRRIEQAQQLANSITNHQLPIVNYPLSILHSSDLPTFNLQPFNLIVNTTPVGMTPNINESPLPENLPLPSNIFIYDLVYNPRET
ncbi:MAG: shikimate dehydrogenase, partial [Anaerolineales bacterium]|nr:shikimate dehydrogenase [Anaerolineales bacterium]